MSTSPKQRSSDYVPITRPLIGEEEVQAVAAVLRSGWLAQGSRVADFERMVADYVGSAGAVATTSCTTALNLAVLQMAPQPGDEVLVPAFTWVATANAVELAGAKPVFVDIDPRTFNLDPDAAAAAITGRTVGMVPVHLFGLAAPMESLVALAQRHGLWVVEDAACALGTTIGDRHVGTFGDIGCFSFHPRKSISTGEGGMLIAQRSDDLELARSLRNHGVETDDAHSPDGDLPDHPRVGFNYRMTDLQAAVGIAQMRRLDGILASRRGAAQRYERLLADLSWLRRPQMVEGHSFQAYVCMLTEDAAGGSDLHEARGRLIAKLHEAGIGTRPGTHAPVRMTYYRETYELAPAAFPNAIAAERFSIALPLFAGMTNDQVDYVASTMRSFGRG